MDAEVAVGSRPSPALQAEAEALKTAVAGAAGTSSALRSPSQLARELAREAEEARAARVAADRYESGCMTMADIRLAAKSLCRRR